MEAIYSISLSLLRFFTNLRFSLSKIKRRAICVGGKDKNTTRENVIASDEKIKISLVENLLVDKGNKFRKYRYLWGKRTFLRMVTYRYCTQCTLYSIHILGTRCSVTVPEPPFLSPPIYYTVGL